jgi:hypothetical protein
MEDIMKTLITLTAALVVGTMAQADSMIDTLCGSEHVNEAAGPLDIRENPDGYYIASLETQLSHGDLRIVQAVGETFHLCTRSAAIPEMDTPTAILLMDERTVRYLFVPNQVRITPRPRT